LPRAADQLGSTPAAQRALARLESSAPALMMAAGARSARAHWGGTRYPWLSAQIFLLFALSVACTAAFWWRITTPGRSLPAGLDPKTSGGSDGRAAERCAIGAPSAYRVRAFSTRSCTKLHASDSGLALIPIAVMTTPGRLAAADDDMRHLSDSAGSAFDRDRATIYLAVYPASSPHRDGALR